MTVTITATTCPAIGPISTPYGFNIADYPDVANEGCGGLSRCHNGIDIAANAGTLVKSPFDGTISTVSSDSFKGNYLVITSGDLAATFEHLGSIVKTQDSQVTKGEVIGSVGSSGAVTGPVLHYKITKGGVLINPFRTLGNSTTLHSSALTASDDISQNNYSNIPAGSIASWGDCNQ